MGSAKTIIKIAVVAIVAVAVVSRIPKVRQLVLNQAA